MPIGKTDDEGSSQSTETNHKKTFGRLRDKLKGTSLYDVKVGAIHAKHQVGKLENLYASVSEI